MKMKCNGHPCITFDLDVLECILLFYQRPLTMSPMDDELSKKDIIEFINSLGFHGKIDNIVDSCRYPLKELPDNVTIILIIIPLSNDLNPISLLNDIEIYEFNTCKNLLRSYNIKNTLCNCIRSDSTYTFEDYMDDFIDSQYSRYKTYIIQDKCLKLGVDLMSYIDIDIYMNINIFIAYSLDRRLNSSILDYSSNRDSNNHDWYLCQKWDVYNNESERFNRW